MLRLNAWDAEEVVQCWQTNYEDFRSVHVRHGFYPLPSIDNCLTNVLKTSLEEPCRGEKNPRRSCNNIVVVIIPNSKCAPILNDALQHRIFSFCLITFRSFKLFTHTHECMNEACGIDCGSVSIDVTSTSGLKPFFFAMHIRSVDSGRDI